MRKKGQNFSSPISKSVYAKWDDVIGKTERDIFKNSFTLFSRSGLLTDPARALRGLLRCALKNHVDKFGMHTKCESLNRVQVVYLTDVLRFSIIFADEDPNETINFLRDSDTLVFFDGAFNKLESFSSAFRRVPFARPWSNGLPVVFVLTENSYFYPTKTNSQVLYTPPAEGDLFLTVKGTTAILCVENISCDVDSSDEDSDSGDEHDLDMDRETRLLMVTECYECDVYELAFPGELCLTGRQKPKIVIPHPHEMSKNENETVLATVSGFMRELNSVIGSKRLRTSLAIDHLTTLKENALLRLLSNTNDDWMPRMILREYFLRSPWIMTKSMRDIDEKNALPMVDGRGAPAPSRQHFSLRDTFQVLRDVGNEHYRIDPAADLYARKKMEADFMNKKWIRWSLSGWSAKNITLRCDRSYESCFQFAENIESPVQLEVEEALVKLSTSS